MKLMGFSVTNYRSITTAHKIILNDLTVLVGKNNEGKSNLLLALKVAMNAVIVHSNPRRARILTRKQLQYDWERDFPLQFQGRKSGLESIFRLNFRLNDQEIQELHGLTGTRGNGDIPIEIRIGRDCIPKVRVPKRGSSSYNNNSEQITEFISNRISINYIQAVRTGDMAIRELQNIIIEELMSLEDDPEYIEAWNIIDTLEKGVLDRIAEGLVDPLKAFLPSLNNVSIIKSRYNTTISHPRSMIDVIIDDGIATSISNKGDGIKSLVTLAILKERRESNITSIIAIEEPESHLHSGAIHSLVEVIHKISENRQVIITTHNPLFVQQNKVSSNVIVDGGTARTAKSIAEIRSVLGVLPSDNLRNARFVLVVEGEEDKISLEKILPCFSDTIGDALKSNLLVIKPLGGAGNLSHDLSDLKHSLCQYVVLLDNDDAGIKAANKAIEQGLLTLAQVRYTICQGSPEAEFEDCIKPSIYKDSVLEKFNINIMTREFKSNKKWSDRMKNVFLSQGLRWTDQTERQIKLLVADAIPSKIESINDVLIIQKSGFLNGLVNAIKTMIVE